MIFQGFVGPAYTTQSVNASAEDLINLYVESHESKGATPSQVLYGTPGLSAPLMTLPNTPVRAQFYQDNRSFAIGGGTFYETTTGAPVLIGGVANDGLPATLHSNGQAGHQLFIVSGGNGYIYDLNSGAFAPIGAAAFPTGTALQGAFADGYFLVVTSRKFQISKLEDGTTWNGSDFAPRSISSDDLVGFLVNHRELWLFGSLQTEAWYNNGAANFPYAPINGVLLDQGLAARWSACRFDNSVAWLAQNRDGDRMVMLVNQLSPQRISTQAVEASLRSCATVSDFVAFTYQENGHSFYVLSSVINKLTWAYDAATQTWGKRAYLNPVTGQLEAIRAANHAAAFGSHWVGDRTSGNIYTQGLDLYSDNGAAIRRVRRAPHLVDEQKLITYDAFQLDAEMGVGLPAGQGSDPQIMLRYSNDGGFTWSNEITLPLGKQGERSRRAIARQLGAGRNRVFDVAMTDPVKVAWTAAYLTIREAVH